MPHVYLKKTMMSHVPAAYFSPCYMQNLRKGHVTCHYIFSPPGASHPYVACQIQEMKMLILGVAGLRHGDPGDR